MSPTACLSDVHMECLCNINCLSLRFSFATDASSNCWHDCWLRSILTQPLPNKHGKRAYQWKTHACIDTFSASETPFGSFFVDGIVCLLYILPLLVLITPLLESCDFWSTLSWFSSEKEEEDESFTLSVSDKLDELLHLAGQLAEEADVLNLHDSMCTTA